MIQKVKITKVVRYTTKKDKATGVETPYTYAKGTNIGKPFTRVGIQTDKTGEDTYFTNAMAGEKADKVAVGESHLLNFTTSKSADGNMEFKNFNFPTKEQLAEFADQVA